MRDVTPVGAKEDAGFVVLGGVSVSSLRDLFCIARFTPDLCPGLTYVAAPRLELGRSDEHPFTTECVALCAIRPKSISCLQ